MAVNHCISIFDSLQQVERRKSFSKLFDSLNSFEKELVLGLFDKKIESMDGNANINQPSIQTKDFQGKTESISDIIMPRDTPRREDALENNSIAEGFVKKSGNPSILNRLPTLLIEGNPIKKKGRKKSEPAPRIPCPCCDETFEANYLLRNHVFRKHKNDEGREFLEDIVKKVRIQEKSSNNNACEQCGKKFKHPWKVRQHISADHQNLTPFVCDVCAKAFKKIERFRVHMKVHQDILEYSCDFCEKKFRITQNLANHRRRIHTGERPWKCDKCPWSGPDSSSFTHHKKKH